MMSQASQHSGMKDLLGVPKSEGSRGTRDVSCVVIRIMISAHAEKGNQGEHQKGGSPDADETEKCECIDKIWQGMKLFQEWRRTTETVVASLPLLWPTQALLASHNLLFEEG